jgi:hypothetical protein
VLGGARFALVTILVVVVVATGEDDDESSRGHGDDEAFFWRCVRSKIHILIGIGVG